MRDVTITLSHEPGTYVQGGPGQGMPVLASLQLLARWGSGPCMATNPFLRLALQVEGDRHSGLLYNNEGMLTEE